LDEYDHSNIVIVGDFNFRGIDWLTLEGSNYIENAFIETILDNSLSQLVTQPTRGKNIFDLVLTDNVI